MYCSNDSRRTCPQSSCVDNYLPERSTNFPALHYYQDTNKCWLKCSQVALILPLLLWAGIPETKTVTACAEQYAAL